MKRALVHILTFAGSGAVVAALQGVADSMAGVDVQHFDIEKILSTALAGAVVGYINWHRQSPKDKAINALRTAVDDNRTLDGDKR